MSTPRERNPGVKLEMVWNTLPNCWLNRPKSSTATTVARMYSRLQGILRFFFPAGSPASFFSMFSIVTPFYRDCKGAKVSIAQDFQEKIKKTARHNEPLPDRHSLPHGRGCAIYCTI